MAARNRRIAEARCALRSGCSRKNGHAGILRISDAIVAGIVARRDGGDARASGGTPAPARRATAHRALPAAEHPWPRGKPRLAGCKDCHRSIDRSKRVQFVELARAAGGQRRWPSNLESPRLEPRMPEEVARGIPTKPIPADRPADGAATGGRQQSAGGGRRASRSPWPWPRWRRPTRCGCPSLRGGTNYNRHDGAIQDVRGIQIQHDARRAVCRRGRRHLRRRHATRSRHLREFSPGRRLVSAAGRPAVRRLAQPGRGRRNQRHAVAGDAGLLRTAARGRGPGDSPKRRATTPKHLADLTRTYAETGEGLPSDANRARTELALRRVDVERSREAQRVASARLSRNCCGSIRRACSCRPIRWSCRSTSCRPTCRCEELVAEGLTLRPELAENRQLVAEAVTRMRRETTGRVRSPASFWQPVTAGWGPA